MTLELNSNSTLTGKERKDLKVLALFTAVYCVAHHSAERAPLTGLPVELHKLRTYHCCADCRAFLFYAVERRLKCPLDDKPACKNCHVHCYRQDHRQKVREIMRFSGKALIRRGRLDLLWQYFF